MPKTYSVDMTSGTAHFIPLSEISDDSTYKVRVQEDGSTIQEYAQLLCEYKEDIFTDPNVEYPFPPIVYVKCGERKILLAGFHRYLAAREAGCEEIWASEFTGDEKEAIKLAVESNRRHGVRYQYGDFQIAIQKLLEYEPDMKLIELRRLTGASKSHCSQIRSKVLDEKGGFTSEHEEESSTQEGFTSGPLTKPAKPSKADRKKRNPQKKNPNVTHPPEDEKDEFDIVRWECLDGLDVETQIARILYVIETFEKMLNKTDQQQFYKKVQRWLDKKRIVDPLTSS